MTCARCHDTGELHRQDCGAHGMSFPCPACARNDAIDALIAGDADLYDVPGGAMTPEQCVMVCPQCDGEGTYSDGLDDAACSTTCSRCESNGWIVDVHSFEYASARIKGDKVRENPDERPHRDDAARLDRQELEDLIADAIADSFDPDWSHRDGARAVLAALEAHGYAVIEAPPNWNRGDEPEPGSNEWLMQSSQFHPGDIA